MAKHEHEHETFERPSRDEVRELCAACGAVSTRKATPAEQKEYDATVAHLQHVDEHGAARIDS